MKKAPLWTLLLHILHITCLNRTVCSGLCPTISTPAGHANSHRDSAKGCVLSIISTETSETRTFCSWQDFYQGNHEQDSFGSGFLPVLNRDRFIFIRLALLAD